MRVIRCMEDGHDIPGKIKIPLNACTSIGRTEQAAGDVRRKHENDGKIIRKLYRNGCIDRFVLITQRNIWSNSFEFHFKWGGKIAHNGVWRFLLEKRCFFNNLSCFQNDAIIKFKQFTKLKTTN